MSFATVDRPAVGEVNGLVNGQAYHAERHAQVGGVEKVYWTEPGLKITRFRLSSDPGLSTARTCYKAPRVFDIYRYLFFGAIHYRV